MSTTNSTGNRVVRSGSGWGPRLLLCLIAFVATSATVVWMSGRLAGRPEFHAATATIWHRAPHSSETGTPSSAGELRLDASSVERQIMSEQSLRHALSRVESSPPEGADADPWAVAAETIEQVRRQLRVAGGARSSPGRRGVAITFADEDPDRAIRLVNTLAQGYADQHRAKLEATIHQEYVKARDAVELARQEYLEAKGQFDDFVAQHFLRQQALAESRAERDAEPAPPEAPPTAEPSPEAVEVPPPEPTENSERVELKGRLAELEQQREQLVITRTPEHPEVLYVDAKIAALQQRLASLPEEVVVPPPVPPMTEGPQLDSPVGDSPLVTQEPVDPEPTVEEYVEAVGQYRDCKERLEQARREYDRLSEIKRRARERELRAVTVELDLASETQLVLSAPDRSPRSLLGALGAALAVALGVGMISAGFDTDLPLTTPTAVERALRVPVVGTVPPRESSSRRATRRGSPRARRWAKLLGGALLVAVCFGILVLVL